MKFDTRILNLRAHSHPTYSRYPTNRIRQCVAQVLTSVVWLVANLAQVQSVFFFPKVKFRVPQIRFVKYEVIYIFNVQYVSENNFVGLYLSPANAQKQGIIY